jgi:hypothetical protein
MSALKNVLLELLSYDSAKTTTSENDEQFSVAIVQLLELCPEFEKLGVFSDLIDYHKNLVKILEEQTRVELVRRRKDYSDITQFILDNPIKLGYECEKVLQDNLWELYDDKK